MHHSLFFRLASCVAVVIAGLGAWAFWLEPSSLVVHRTTVPIAAWPVTAELRVAILTDLHVGSPYTGLSKLRRVVEETNAEQCDIIVLLGDFVIQEVRGGTVISPEAIASELAALRAPLGVFAVLGNHDWWLDQVRVATALRARSIEVLSDEARRLPLRYGGGVWIVGISDYMEGKHDVTKALASVVAGEPVLAITHNPDIFPEIPARVGLTLAGHTHGGQVNLPLLGRLVVPSQYGRRYAAGHVVEDGRHLIVSTGVGTSIIPVRFRVPPEILVVHVTKA